MAATGIATRVLNYFQKNEGKVITVDELIEALGFTRQQTLQSINNLSRTPLGASIEKLQTGAWKYATPVDTRCETWTIEILKETDEAVIGMCEGNVYKIILLG